MTDNTGDPVQVECYSGYTYAQEPRAFERGGRRYQVTRIVKRWRTPQGPIFRVEASSTSDPQPPVSKLVDLTYLEVEDKWTMGVPD